jgi:glycosyltransferase involved in cell wall biosynthesis
MNTKLIVVILSRNRINFIDDALQSVFNQTDCNFELFISDNSTNDYVSDYVSKNYPEINLIRRSGMLTAFEHYNLLLNSFNDGWLHVLHDDDILGPSFIEEINILINNLGNNFVAFATNGHTQGYNQKINWFYSKKNIILMKKTDLVNRYLSPRFGGIAPFSSYVFNMKILNKKQIIVNSAYHYSDMIFLINLLDLGKIYWLNKPIFFIREHPFSLSKNAQLKSAKMVIDYIKFHFPDINPALLGEFYFFKLIYNLRVRGKIKSKNKLIIFNIHYYLNLYYLRILYLKVVHRLTS